MLFLDIVGSTTIADEVGDEAWRTLLARFRRAVRAELKRHGGREVDTAGDGFFATFPQPLAAIDAADAITTSVHELGLDVRVGIHTGEVELSDGHVSGMTVHIGARAMALADAAQVVVTSTVRDMEVGSPVRFEDAGEHELKGVAGRWHLYRATGIGTHVVEPPLGAEEAGRRQAGRVGAAPPHEGRPVARCGGRPPRRGGRVHRVRGPAKRVDVPAAHDADDPGSDRSADARALGGRGACRGYCSRHPRTSEGHSYGSARTWSSAEIFGTGTLDSRFPVPSWMGVGVGGGGIWLCRSGPGEWPWRFSRFDPLSGRETGHSDALSCNNGLMLTGPGGIWFVDELGNLVRLDPLPPYRIKWWDDIFRFPTQPFAAVPYGRGVWLVDTDGRQLTWYEPASGSPPDDPFPHRRVRALGGRRRIHPRACLDRRPGGLGDRPLG